MQLQRPLIAGAATALVFLALDFLWLGVLMGPSYRAWLGPLLRSTPYWPAALLFYTLYIAGLVGFGVRPWDAAQSAAMVGLRCALLGWFAYATYDLTNLATLNNWPWQLALVDMLWGGVVSGIAGAAGFVAVQHWARRGAG